MASQLIKLFIKMYTSKRSTITAKIKIIALILLFFSNHGLNAHHSSAMFNKSELKITQAEVKEFQWANPHVWIQILVINENNQKEEWSIEGIGINTLFRRGWRPNSFKAGDLIEISFNPMIDGSNGGLFVGAKFDDGKILGKWNDE